MARSEIVDVVTEDLKSRVSKDIVVSLGYDGGLKWEPPAGMYTRLLKKYVKDGKAIGKAVGNPDNQKEKFMIQIAFLVKLGFAAGKSVPEIRTDILGHQRPDHVEFYQSRLAIFDAVMDGIRDEIDKQDANVAFYKFVERKRALIGVLDDQLERIRKHWDRMPMSTQLHREYAGIIKLISDLENDIMDFGKEMGIFKEKGEERTVVFKSPIPMRGITNGSNDQDPQRALPAESNTGDGARGT